ncbi:MAG: hypothetical protein ABI718_08345 [Acidobacteriota bacterium]
MTKHAADPRLIQGDDTGVHAILRSEVHTLSQRYPPGSAATPQG